MAEGSPQRKRIALLVLLPLAAIGLLYAASRSRPPETPPAPEPTAAAVRAPTAPAPAETPPDVAAAEPEVPGFDVVRVEPDGSAAVVGTAEPGARVTIYADEAPLAEAEADADGNFVAIFRVDPAEEPRALTLGAVAPGGAASTSEDVVMLLPPAPGTAEPEAQPAPETESAAAPGEEPEPVAPAPVVLPEAGAAPEVAATVILRRDEVEVTPAPPDASGRRPVTLGAVSYGETGEVSLAGAGTAGAMVRAYVDDGFVGEAQVAPDGRWRMQLAGLAEGIYRLRVDLLAADGRVASRVETPFQRDYPPPPPPRPGAPRPGAVPGSVAITVQPGSNLWTLARIHYGSGVRYTQIFTANRDQIRDPDLIYPGQIFTIPEPTATE
ncbi:MAG TPA: LysM peptidoglycan-binding domain-containing protein [Amaricoccus sp.]|uniref:LysM peptidoglycan-binding domain-containing protein n=1 Tax=Amaricoccus sp. TaxID=1872485 RepID=UPI002BA1FDE6|nr:Ig-like domain-containing protein [Amaricoccus sp.]HRO11105.1 LysM peptidoglycan-binding domain-containing protein [Amaricoccus sp.]